MNKIRLDALLVARGLAESKTKAQAMIRAGEVTVDGQRMDKPGMTVVESATVEVRRRPRWVSRAGSKLEAALERFELPVNGLVALDVGASTGGFTDVLLAHGALRVYSVDVGRAQLSWSLRNDTRVVSMERTDIRSVEELPEPIDIAVVDVAFISLTLVLPSVKRLIRPGAPVVTLVKPQFEAGRSNIGRGGIVRESHIHRAVVERIIRKAMSDGWNVLNAMRSPIVGSAGNQEFLVYFRSPLANIRVPISENRDLPPDLESERVISDLVNNALNDQ